MKVKKTYRLEQEIADKITADASAEGISATEVIERAVRAYQAVESPAKGDSQATDTLVIKALTDQLAVKDDQITTLGDALKAAQALNAASLKSLAESPVQTLPTGPTETEIQARIDAAVSAERGRISKLSLMDRLRRRF